jgi:hypothetical protein
MCELIDCLIVIRNDSGLRGIYVRIDNQPRQSNFDLDNPITLTFPLLKNEDVQLLWIFWKRN